MRFGIVRERDGDTVRPNERLGMGVAETRDFGDVFSRGCVCRRRELYLVGEHESGGDFSHLSRFELRIGGERYGRFARIYEPGRREES